MQVVMSIHEYTTCILECMWERNLNAFIAATHFTIKLFMLIFYRMVRIVTLKCLTKGHVHV